MINSATLIARRSLSATLVATTLLTGFSSLQAADTFSWPNGATAAVCLTYDDALDSHLDIAVPQLNEANLPGTFFINGSSDTMSPRLDEWKALAHGQNEIASHTLYHPCRKSSPGRDWVTEERDLDRYSLAQITSELEVNNTLLQSLDGKIKRTFAYPCGDTTVDHGNTSYRSVTSEKFVAARGVSSRIEPIEKLSFYNTPTFDAAEKSLDELVAYVEDSARKGTVAVIMFHGVGGNYLRVDGEVHREFLAFLEENSDRLWTATYIDAMSHARSEFQRLDWPINH